MQLNAFEALADPDRQRLLLALADADGPLRVPEDLPGAGDDETAVRYYHAHLPKLDDYGFVDWDPERQTVEPGPAFASLAPLLSVLRADAPAD